MKMDLKLVAIGMLISMAVILLLFFAFDVCNVKALGATLGSVKIGELDDTALLSIAVIMMVLPCAAGASTFILKERNQLSKNIGLVSIVNLASVVCAALGIIIFIANICETNDLMSVSLSLTSIVAILVVVVNIAGLVLSTLDVRKNTK